MLYYRALTHGLAPLPEANAQVRAALAARASDAGGWQALHAGAGRARSGGRRTHTCHRCATHPARARSARDHRAANLRVAATGATCARDPGAVCITTADRVLNFTRASSTGSMPCSRRVSSTRCGRCVARGDLHRDLPSMRAVGYRQTVGACRRASRVRRGRGRGQAGDPQPGQAPTDMAAGRFRDRVDKWP